MSNILINKIFNERVKLGAVALNAIAVACVISALIFPAVREGNEGVLSNPQTYIWTLIGFALHLCALTYLGLLRSAPKHTSQCWHWSC